MIFSRRQFLIAACGTALGSGVAVWHFATCPSLAERLEQFLPYSEAVAKVAKAYLDTHPNETNPKQLEMALFPEGRWGLNFSSTEAVKQRINQKIADDFANGSMVELDGWLLSKTEVQVYCLLYLQHTTQRHL